MTLLVISIKKKSQSINFFLLDNLINIKKKKNGEGEGERDRERAQFFFLKNTNKKELNTFIILKLFHFTVYHQISILIPTILN